MESLPPPPKSHRRELTSISDLPANIIDEILIRIPIREAVRTSILSRTWHHKWKSLPDLRFGFNNDDVDVDDDVSAADIDRLLLLRSAAPIRSFSLGTDHITVSDTDRWLISLSQHSLSSLSLHFYSLSDDTDLLHSSLFSFKSLKFLSLYRCSIPSPSSFAGGYFPMLQKLHLRRVVFPNDKCLSDLIAESPNLADLSLIHVTPSPRSLVIANPNLRYFGFVGDECNSIIFAAAQVLEYEYVSINLYGPHFDLTKSFPVGGAVCNGTFCLGDAMMGVLVKRGVPKNIPSCFHSLAVLDVNVNLYSAWQTMLFLNLIRNAPNLKEIKISNNHHTASFKDGADIFANDFWKQQDVGQLNSLQNVVMHLYRDVRPATGLIKLILGRAHLLNKLQIICFSWFSPTDELTLDCLKRCKRASAKVEVIYEDKYWYSKYWHNGRRGAGNFVIPNPLVRRRLVL